MPAICPKISVPVFLFGRLKKHLIHVLWMKNLTLRSLLETVSLAIVQLYPSTVEGLYQEFISKLQNLLPTNYLGDHASHFLLEWGQVMVNIQTEKDEKMIPPSLLGRL